MTLTFGGRSGAQFGRRLLLGAAALLAGSRGAGAVDWYTGDKTSDPDFAPTIVLDASGSLTSKQADFGAAAVTAAVDGNLQQTGVRAHIEAIGGVYNYTTNIPGATPTAPTTPIKVNARQVSSGVLGGYAWVSRDWTYAIYGGVEVIDTNLSYPDANNTTKGLRIGGKIAGELYGTPTKSTMVSAYGSYSSANSQYYTRFKAGYSILGNVFLGPELLVLGDQFYTEYRTGLHMTGLRMGALSLGLSGGALRNSVTGSGGYGILDARLSF